MYAMFERRWILLMKNDTVNSELIACIYYYNFVILVTSTEHMRWKWVIEIWVIDMTINFLICTINICKMLNDKHHSSINDDKYNEFGEVWIAFVFLTIFKQIVSNHQNATCLSELDDCIFQRGQASKCISKVVYGVYCWWYRSLCRNTSRSLSH